MKKFFKRFSRGTLVALVLTLVLVVGVGAAVVYQLNQEVDCTVTINPNPPVQATLYTDALCTIPVTGSTVLNFGTTTVSGSPQTAVWFKTAQILPSSVAVTSDLSASVGTFGHFVGTPSGSLGSCVIALWITPAGATGTFSFHTTATGNS